VIDLKDSLAGRAANFLANHELDKLQEKAIDWRDIAINKLGLSEPTWGEWAWSYITGRPTTWQGRVMSVLDLAKSGLKATALKQGYASMKGAVNDKLGIHEPTLLERATNYALGRDTSLQGRVQAQANSLGERVSGGAADVVDSVKHTLGDTINTIREHIPGTEAAELARQKAWEATHPRSTLDNIKSGA